MRTSSTRRACALSLRLVPLFLVAGHAAAAPMPSLPGPRPSFGAEGPDFFSPSSRFTVVGLPDTQNYSQSFPQIFRAQTEFVVRARESRNIRFVSHYGDVVNNGDRLNEWANARDAMDVIHRSGIPYGVTAGNHDVTPSGVAGSPYIPQNFLDNFGPQRFTDRAWHRGASPTGMSSAQVFTGGGREFLALHINVDTPVAELAWAQGVINANRDKPVMITTHRYLQDAEDYTGGVPIVPSGRYPDIWYTVEGVYHPEGIRSNEFFDSFVRVNPNIFLVNCGHFHEEYRQTSSNIRGNPVHEVLADYQDDPNGGDGWLRLMEFDTARNRIDVQSYSPTLNAFRSADESRFSLPVNFSDYAEEDGFASFQQGVGGYAGTRDTWINEASANTSYGSSGVIVVDDDTTNSIFSDRHGQGMLRFDGIFTSSSEPGKIPLGATITSATLRLTLADDVDSPIFDADFFLHQMLVDWGETSTWNSMGSGLQAGADYGSLVAVIEGDNDPDADFLRVIDVAAAVQAWANGAPNFGFAILPEIISGNDDGIEIWSAQHGNVLLRPALDVTWTLPTIAVPEPGSALLMAVSLGLVGGRRRR